MPGSGGSESEGSLCKARVCLFNSLKGIKLVGFQGSVQSLRRVNGRSWVQKSFNARVS